MKILWAELNFQGHEDNTKTNLTSYAKLDSNLTSYFATSRAKAKL